MAQPADAQARCFCLSKAKAPPTASAAREQELRRRKVSELHRDALAAGVPPADVEGALDDEAPKDAIIALLLDHEGQVLLRLKEELAPLKPAALRQRAQDAGAGAEEIDAALDADDAKAALTALIVEIEGTPRAGDGGKPEDEGAPQAEDSIAEPPKQLTDVQAERLRKELAEPAAAGLPVEDDGEAPRAESEPGQPQQSSSAAEAALRQELGSLKLRELRKRAKEAEMSTSDLEAAMDSDDPEGTVIDFLVSQHIAVMGESEALSALVSELETLKLRELRQRAKEEGIAAEELEDAMDTDEPEAAVIAWLVAQHKVRGAGGGRPGRGGGEVQALDRPHHGNVGARSKPPKLAAEEEPASQPAKGSKHVMLSYQWDSQGLVRRAYDLLTALGLHCWMGKIFD